MSRVYVKKEQIGQTELPEGFAPSQKPADPVTPILYNDYSFWNFRLDQISHVIQSCYILGRGYVAIVSFCKRLTCLFSFITVEVTVSTAVA